MPNTLTGLYPDIYAASNVVSRELSGLITAVSRDSNLERAAIGQNVRVPIAGAVTGADNTPGVTAPNTGDNTVTNVNLGITKSRHFPVRWNGEETKGLTNAGSYSKITQDRFAEAMRAAVNEIETDVFNAAYPGASRAFGTAGTSPFATAADMTDWAGALRILEENGAPREDLQMALGHGAMGNLRGKQSGLFKANEAGTDDFLRNGFTDRVMRFAIRQSNAIGIVTKGTGAAYTTSAAGFAVGVTSIAIITGAGTVLAGDVVTFAGDTNKYVVATGVAAPGTIVLAAPGLRVAIPAAATAMTIGGNFTANLAFSRSAIVLATRQVATPSGGDAATDLMTVVDPATGLAFEIAEYKQFLQTVYHVRLAWGTGVVKPNHIAVLLG